MDPNEPQFLHFSAFETTAFFTAVLVAAYSLIPNPTGRQGPSDRSEYRVYAGWRLAMVVICMQVVLMAVVLGVLLRARASTKAIVWVLLLMAATWAPLADSVQRTVSSWRRVRAMMRSRTARNQLAAVAREYFLTGQRGIAVARIVYWSAGELPVVPLRALTEVPELDDHRDAIRRAATPPVVDVDASASWQRRRSARAGADEARVLLDMGILWSVHQGAQPWDVRGTSLGAVVYAVDPLVRLWTVEQVRLAATPFPDYRRGGDSCGIPRVPHLRSQARYLDMVDELQNGDTLSDELERRAIRGRYCERCALAIRGTVEAFLESNARGHTDMRSEWLRNVDFAWPGRYTAVVDVMWEAAFMEAAATRLAVSEGPDHIARFGDVGKVLTVRMMTVLFLVLRSLGGETPPLAALADRVAARLHTHAYWVDFWELLRSHVSDGGQVAAERIGTGTFRAVTRAMQDREITAVLDLLVAAPIADSLCAVQTCWLHKGTAMRVTRVRGSPGGGGGVSVPSVVPVTAGAK